MNEGGLFTYILAWQAIGDNQTCVINRDTINRECDVSIATESFDAAKLPEQTAAFSSKKRDGSKSQTHMFPNRTGILDFSSFIRFVSGLRRVTCPPTSRGAGCRSETSYQKLYLCLINQVSFPAALRSPDT